MGNTKKFWRKVFGIGGRRLWEEFKGDIMRVIVSLLVIAGISISVGFGLVQSDFQLPLIEGIAEDAQVTIVTLVLFAIILIVINIVTIPPKMYEELGGFVEKPIFISPESHPEEMGITPYMRGLDVQNQTALDVEECMLRLMSATNLGTGESLIRREENLTWSNREKESAGDMPKTIPGHLSKVCDFAGWLLEPISAYFTLAFGPRQRIPLGEHKAIVRISGKWKGHNFNYNEEVIFSYDGVLILLGDERQGNE
ncbi:MAG: hypothetical protein FVQ83_11600 [Chloroflexi bacterium]|nr:hypothetical protein [Chloroflexota bacterium]